MDTEVATEPDPAPGSPHAAAPPATELSAHFPQLEIIGLLGRGGMGWVYKALQTNLDRFVALKVLPPGVAGDPAFAERFQREARALARLNHPNIVAIYDFGQAGPYFYFVMEFVDGANLRQLERSRRLSPEEAFAIVPKLCEALQYAHDEGIVHRDVKPENILIDSRGRLKIADFGIAKIMGGKDITLTGTRHALGTLQYMAPEQLETPGKVDHRADIYALGVVFYEMLTGELPMGRFEPPSRHVQVDVRMDEVVLKSLERSPERRYQTAAAVKTDLESLTHAYPTTMPASPLEDAGSAKVVARDANTLVRRALDWSVWLLVPIAFMAAGGGFDGLIPFKGPAFDAVKVLIVAGCLGFLAWYFRRRKSEPTRPFPDSSGNAGAARTDVKTAPTAAAPGLFSLLGRAWYEWWGERAKRFAIAVQAVLVLLHLACLFGFTGTRMNNRWEDSGHRQFTYAVGAGDPWFTFKTYPTANTPFQSGIHPAASSMLFLIAGFALYYVVWRIEKIRRPKAGFWSSPAAMGIMWALFAISAVGMGTKMGHDALEEDKLGGPLAPQLRSALAITGVVDRDEALHKVALQAAGAKDMKTARRAIQEIRGIDLHDRAAAETALALAKLKNGSAEAVALAGEIRTNSLRDGTLAKIAIIASGE